MTQTTRCPRLAAIPGAVLLATLAACGGGGGGSTPSAADTPLPVGAQTAPTSADAPASSGSESVGSSGTAGPTGSSGTSAPAGSSATTASSDSSITAVNAPALSAAAASTGGSILGDCPMFPSNAIFNTRIDDRSRFPAHPNSDAWVQRVGAGTSWTANWGGSSDPSNLSDYWGLPINEVDTGSVQRSTVSFDFAAGGDKGHPEKSDCANDDGGIARDCASLPASARRFPFPPGQVLAEGGNCGGPGSCGDHHVLVVEKGACRLWEAYYAFNLSGQWYALSTAAWDLRSNGMRPADWASADAAGLPITPLLARADEASTGEIRHALRVTFRDSALALQPTWPARFAAGSDDPGGIPFGSLLRLKADFVVPDDWDPQAKAVANAAKRYGLYVADNGMDFFVQGQPSSGWHAAASQQLRSITMSNMEFVDLRSVTGDPRFDPNSFQASW